MFGYRFIALLKYILLFACLLGGCDYLVKLDHLKKELVDLKAQAATAREAAGQLQQEWQEIKQAKDKLDLLLKREDTLLKQRDLLDTQERRLTAEIKYQADSMVTAVEKTRAAAIGALIPELKLIGRPTLYNAKIFKINDDSISFLHEDGVANLKATAEELPPEYLKKYDLGAQSITRGLQKLLK